MPEPIPNFTPPMPEICTARMRLEDCAEAVQRGLDSWNKTQIIDVIRSARYFLDEAEKSLR
jgi:hypothetical protein